MGSFKVNYIAGGRLDPPFYPTFPNPYIEGFTLDLSVEAEHTFTLPEDREFVAFSMGCESYHDNDNFTVEHNGNVIIETVYTKNLPEGVYLMVAHYVSAGDTLTFKFHGGKESYAKKVWFNYQFLKE